MLLEEGAGEDRSGGQGRKSLKWAGSGSHFGPFLPLKDEKSIFWGRRSTAEGRGAYRGGGGRKVWEIRGKKRGGEFRGKKRGA